MRISQADSTFVEHFLLAEQGAGCTNSRRALNGSPLFRCSLRRRPQGL